MKHELYFQDDNSNKFWTIELIGTDYKTTNGRVGSKGRETIKSFSSVDTAKKAIEKQVKAKLKKGYKEGKAPAIKKIEWDKMPMNDATFWRIIKLFNWRRKDDDLIIKPAVDALKQFSVEDIYKFEDILTEKLYQLDTNEYAKQIGSEAYKEGSYFSSDWFLYTRCCVVANGEDYYKKVLKFPSQYPKDLEFETLLSVARKAFEQKTGEEWNYYNEQLSYETFSNKDGWKNLNKQ